jgi:XPA protein C-terminus
MVLTEEQQERIRKNRERALEIQRKRQRNEEQQQQQGISSGNNSRRKLAPKESQEGSVDEQKASPSAASEEGKDANSKASGKGKVEADDDVELEDFEIGASDLVTKKEAMKVYLLPEGTLAVCPYVAKQNPHSKGFAPMKLYHRSEVRRRSRERFGGLEGLVKERRRREENRFQKDLEQTKNIFR